MRAGVLKNSSRTQTVVPSGHPAALTSPGTPPSRCSAAPAWASRRREKISSRDTAAIAARASPRKPSVPMADRSSARCSLLVAWRRKAVGSCSGAMPQPLSVTRRYVMPPRSSSTDTAVAPASSAFSNNSLHTLAGRSTTSPAAIRSAIWAGSCCICGMVFTPFYCSFAFSSYRRFNASRGLRASTCVRRRMSATAVSAIASSDT